MKTQNKTDRGYVVLATSKSSTNYIECAHALCLSLKHWHPDANITVITDDVNGAESVSHLADVVELPYGDLGGWANDWQVFEASPYHETIKLEADMLVATPIDHWWTLFRKHDMWICNTATDHHQRPVTKSHYRKIFYRNNLPDVYNAITYWRYSRTAQQFFGSVRTMFENWDEVRNALIGGAEEPANTDLIYAMVMEYMGRELFGLPGTGPRLTHMKRRIIGTHNEDWTNELVWELDQGQLRVNGAVQYDLFHYNQKQLAPEFIEAYTDVR